MTLWGAGGEKQVSNTEQYKRIRILLVTFRWCRNEKDIPICLRSRKQGVGYKKTAGDFLGSPVVSNPPSKVWGGDSVPGG